MRPHPGPVPHHQGAPPGAEGPEGLLAGDGFTSTGAEGEEGGEERARRQARRRELLESEVASFVESLLDLLRVRFITLAVNAKGESAVDVVAEKNVCAEAGADIYIDLSSQPRTLALRLRDEARRRAERAKAMGAVPVAWYHALLVFAALLVPFLLWFTAATGAPTVRTSAGPWASCRRAAGR